MKTILLLGLVSATAFSAEDYFITLGKAMDAKIISGIEPVVFLQDSAQRDLQLSVFQAGEACDFEGFVPRYSVKSIKTSRQNYAIHEEDLQDFSKLRATAKKVCETELHEDQVGPATCVYNDYAKYTTHSSGFDMISVSHFKTANYDHIKGANTIALEVCERLNWCDTNRKDETTFNFRKVAQAHHCPWVNNNSKVQVQYVDQPAAAPVQKESWWKGAARDFASPGWYKDRRRY